MENASKSNQLNNVYEELPFRVFKLRRRWFHYECLFGKTNIVCKNEVKYCFCEENNNYESTVVTQSFPMLLEILRFKVHNTENGYCIPQSYYNDCESKMECDQFVNDDSILNIVTELEKEFGTKYNVVLDIEIYVGKKITGNICKQRNVKINLTVVDNKKFESLYKVNNVKKCISYSIIPSIKKFFQEIELSKKISICKIKHDVQFSRLATVQLLQLFVKLFYADNIFSKGSILSIQDIGSKKIGSIDLISYPYSHNIFDSDGIQCRKKYLVQQGVVKNILSNKLYSRMLGTDDMGNADLFDMNKIMHQRLVLRVNEVIPKSEGIVISRCTKIGILENDSVRVSFLGNYHEQHIVCSCKLNLIEFFKNARVYDFLFEDEENVLLQNIVISSAEIEKVFSEI